MFTTGGIEGGFMPEPRLPVYEDVDVFLDVTDVDRDSEDVFEVVL